MKQKMIKLSDTHYIVVDDSGIKESDWFYNPATKEALFASKEMLSWNSDTTQEHKGWKKITHSTQPLEGITHIPLLEVEEAINGCSVEKMADEYSLKVNKGHCDDLYPNCDQTLYEVSYDDYKAGFKAHQELVKDKLFTIDDMRKSFRTGVDWQEGGTILYPDEHGFIQSLLPKNEWNVEIEPYYTDECERLEGTRDGENIKVTYKIKLI